MPLPTDELVVVVRPGPATWTTDGTDGKAAGLDADLMRLFAARKKLPLRVVPVSSGSDVVAAVAAGRAHIGVGGLYRPAPPHARLADRIAGRLLPGRAQPAVPARPAVLWSSGYFSVEPVLVYNGDGARPAAWRDLDGENVAYATSSGFADDLVSVRNHHPDVHWTGVAAESGNALIAQVSDGKLDYAVVGSHHAALARNVYLNFDIAFPVDGQREIAWAVSPEAAALLKEIDAFFAELKRDGTLPRLVDRYYGHVGEVPRIDAGIMQDRIRTLLPQFRTAFHQAQQATGIEWRLLAAVSYQESQWDPGATSETGVRGIMQLTEDTARRLGVLDRLDPKLSIEAAARYLMSLKAKLPSRIQEPDRTWLALAAFNIGPGHLEDARVLAQRQKLNPDSWSDLKKTLPLLAQPEYYEQAKLGYARGGMPVAFVDRVRAYYDVLLAHQPAYQPRLQVLVTASGEPTLAMR
jgi:membrane-bound lytic murein transglycosylase F